MCRRWSPARLLAPALAMSVAAGLAASSPARADASADLATFVERCRTFDGMSADVTLSGASGKARPMRVSARDAPAQR